MKKKILVILLATLMSATVLAGIPTVSSELIEEPGEEMGDWELLYQVDGVPDGSHPSYPDLTVYRIERLHFLGNNWMIRYWIYSTKEFNATFTDEVALDDDEDWWHIDNITHNSELMCYGINGPYHTRWFPAPYKGWFDCNVYLDIDNDVYEGPTGGEDNNHDYITALFWWLF